ncbi:MAG: ATP-dependent DNA helicase RecG [Clostridia bacterium]|nr:ATP-dependent DNA helicase RecG [Clostridia bacterium]
MVPYLSEIRYLKGVGEKKAHTLNKLGVDTVGALLRFYPRAYEDWGTIDEIYSDNLQKTVCIRAVVVSDVTEHPIRNKLTLYKFFAADQSGRMQVTIYNNKYLAQKIAMGREYLFYGKMDGNIIYRNMSSPEISEVGSNAIKPIYHASANMSSKVISSLVKTALLNTQLPDPLPSDVLKEYNLCDLNTAISNIHFPKTKELLERARKRLIFEELFLLQAGFIMLRNAKRTVTDVSVKNEYTNQFLSVLPFELTSAQKRVIGECMADIKSGQCMNRLIQGDVGSGKTLVAAALMFNMVKNGYQSAFMAPTEVLAQQHFKSLSALFEQFSIKCALLTGSVTAANKNKIKTAIANGEVDIVIGTHAIITDDTLFDNLGLVITDEQHRFGVAQRSLLAKKGNHPHTLVMSATPIPRTLALTIYGDLDISIIDEYPKGRTPIETYAVGSDKRQRAYNYIKKHLDEGRQGYIVCPLVEEGENTDLISAEEHYKKLSENEFKNYSVGLLHGKMTAKEKTKIMREFADGQIDLLVCTTVVEVGIDVANAAILAVENAERFGLSALHQLRGRVGRGKYKSTCIFISDSESKNTKARLNIMCSTNDGFKIADEDLKLRGPGDFLGKKQHGLPDLKIADFVNDMQIVRASGNAAKKCIINDPSLSKPENANLKAEIRRMFLSAMS